MLEQNTKAIALLFGQNWLIFITFHFAIKINQCFKVGHLWMIFEQNTKAIYFLAQNGSFSSLFNLKSKSINFKFGHLWVMFEQHTKAIALLVGHKWPTFTFQSAIEIDQCQSWSSLGDV